MKKIIIAFIVLAFSLSIANAAAVKDVGPNHLYVDSIQYLYTQDIVNGYSDNTFRPDSPITRGEFTKVIIEAVYPEADPNTCTTTIPKTENPNEAYLGISTDYLKIQDFLDVKRTDTFGGYICIAKKEKIINGYLDGKFKPEDQVTVGQASKIIAIAMGLIDQETINKGEYDKFKIFIDALAKSKALPSTLGTIDTPIKRGEMAEIVYRLKKSLTNKESKVYGDFY